MIYKISWRKNCFPLPAVRMDSFYFERPKAMQRYGRLRVLLILFLSLFFVGQNSSIAASRQARQAAHKLQPKIVRFNGPKPHYDINYAHVPGHRGFKPEKTPLPKDAHLVYKNAVPNSPTHPTAWFGKNADGQIYRFSDSKDGKMHFSGIDGVGKGVRNLTDYAKSRLEKVK